MCGRVWVLVCVGVDVGVDVGVGVCGCGCGCGCGCAWVLLRCDGRATSHNAATQQECL